MIIICTNSRAGFFTRGKLYEMKLAIKEGCFGPCILTYDDNGGEHMLTNDQLDKHFCVSWFGSVVHRVNPDNTPYLHWELNEDE